MTFEEPKKIERILLCNLAHIGDLILSTAVLPVLKSAFPESRIGFLVGSWCRPVVEDHIYVDWVHCFDHPQLNRSSLSQKEKKKQGNRTWWSAITEVREKDYDVAIDLYYFYKANSGSLLFQSGISNRVGFWASPHHYYFNRPLFWNHRGLQMVQQHGRMLQEWGVEEKHLLHLKQILEYKENPKALPYLAELKERYIVLHMGTGERRRAWTLLQWNALLAELKSLQLPLIFIGHGPQECSDAEQVVAQVPQAINLCGRLGWKDLIPLIRDARLLIGLESMAGHMAATFNTPSVVLYAKQASVTLWRPHSNWAHVLTPPAPTKRSETHAITPDRVFEAVKRQLST